MSTSKSTEAGALLEEGLPQCPAIHPTRRGAVFCTKRKGHEERGDPEHRGFRKRWTGQAPGTPPLAAVAMVALREMSQEERIREAAGAAGDEVKKEK